MDNSTRRARERKLDKYRQGIADHKIANPDVKVHYKVLAFGVLGAIPVKFENILTDITTKARTDWLITQIHRAILVHNAAIWITRDKKHNKEQGVNLDEEELEDELLEPMDVDL